MDRRLDISCQTTGLFVCLFSDAFMTMISVKLFIDNAKYRPTVGEDNQLGLLARSGEVLMAISRLQKIIVQIEQK